MTNLIKTELAILAFVAALALIAIWAAPDIEDWLYEAGSVAPDCTTDAECAELCPPDDPDCPVFILDTEEQAQARRAARAVANGIAAATAGGR